MSHNGILASHSALRAFYCNSTPDAKDYVFRMLGFKSMTSLMSRLNGLVPCDIHLLKKMIQHNEYYKKNMAVTNIGDPANFDIEQLEKYYNALLVFIGSNAYQLLTNKKKNSITEEQKLIYKLINK